MKGMLFKGAMALGVLSLRKTKTRRTNGGYNVGDVVYLKETWCSAYRNGCSGTLFRADGDFVQGKRMHPKGPHYNANDFPEWAKWRSPLHLPEWAARATIRIVSKHMERPQDISDADVIAEGCQIVRAVESASGCRPIWSMDPNGGPELEADSLREAFRKYLTLINGPELWERNEPLFVYGLQLVYKVSPESRRV